MKTIKIYLMTLMLMVFSSLSLASETTTPVEKGQSLSEIKTELIENLKNDGLITGENATIALQKYGNIATEHQKLMVQDDTGWRSYLTLANAMKLVGVILIFIAFSGWISKLVRACWIVIAAIPIIAYQAVALGASLTATIAPALIWESQSFYVVLLASFLNLAIIGWILATYPRVVAFLEKIFKLDIPVDCVGLFYLSVYFAVLGFYHMSIVFATLTAFTVTALIATSIVHYMEKPKKGAEKEKSLSQHVIHVVVGSTIAFMIGLYTVLKVTGIAPEIVGLFNVSVQYIMIAVLAFILQLYTSPFSGFDSKHSIFDFSNMKRMGIATIITGLFAIYAAFAYVIFDMKVAATLVLVSLVILAFQWVIHYGYKVGVLFGSALIGALLYGSALLVEKWGSLLVFY